MNKYISIFGQILQVFSKNEFYGAVNETAAEGMQRDLPVAAVECFFVT